MTFPEAMAEILAGNTVRADHWGPRRAIRLTLEPWNGERERVLFCDLKGEVPPFPYSPTGDDVRSDQWQIVE